MVTKLLERAIEIEGLLRIIRDGNPLPETYTMLSNKAVELAEGVMLLEERAPLTESTDETITTAQKGESLIVMTQDTSGSEFKVDKIEDTTPPAIDMIEEGEPLATENEEIQDDLSETDEGIVDFSETNTPEVSTNTLNTDVQFTENEEDEDDILLTFEEEGSRPEESIPMDNNVGEAAKDTSEGKEESDVDTEKSVIEIKEEEPEDVAMKEDIEIINDDKEKKPAKKPAKLKSAFSLNDRFLYSREIFDGKMKMFDSTLEFIEDIDNFSVIEDFFYNEMELDPENPSVISFMEILRRHFIND